MNEQFQQRLLDLVKLLVAGKYSEAEKMTNGVRLNSQEIAKAIEDYGRHLVLPPTDAFELMDVVEIRNAAPPRWSVTMPLWTREEGRSDLSLEVTMIGSKNTFEVELDDIHVL